MTDEYVQPSPADGSEEISNLLTRRQYLTDRMEAATDPNLRSSFAYELNVLETRLGELTNPQPPRINTAPDDPVDDRFGASYDELWGDHADPPGDHAVHRNEHPLPQHRQFEQPRTEPEPQHLQLDHEQLSAMEPPTAVVENGWLFTNDVTDTPMPAGPGADESQWADPTPIDGPQNQGEAAGEQSRTGETGPAPGPTGAGVYSDALEYGPDTEWPTDPNLNLQEISETMEISGAELDAATWPVDANVPDHLASANGENPEEQIQFVNDEIELTELDIEAAYDEPDPISVQAFDASYLSGYPPEWLDKDQPDPAESQNDNGASTGQDHDQPVGQHSDQALPFGNAPSGLREAANGAGGEHGQDLDFNPSSPGIEQFSYNGDYHHTDNGSEYDPPYDTELTADQAEEYETYDAGGAGHIDADERLDFGPPTGPAATGGDHNPPGQEQGAYRQADLRRPDHRPDGASAGPGQHRPAGPESSGSRTPPGPHPDDDYFIDEDENTTPQQSRVQLAGFSREQLSAAPTLIVAGVCLALLAGVLWFGGDDSSPETAQSISSGAKSQAQVAEDGPERAVADVRAALERLGVTNMVVDFRDGTIFVGGPVATQRDLDAAAGAAQATAGNYPVNTAALVVLGGNSAADSQTSSDGDAPPPAGPAVSAGSQMVQSELDRILAVTPIIFDTAQTTLTPLHERVLNNVVLVLQNQPNTAVAITGYTDENGANDANRQISLQRAESVKAYLVSQGVPSESLRVDARGEESATGSASLAGLERRVEFEVEGTAAAPANDGPIRIGVVAPSAANDLAFTQSMVDAVNLVAGERGLTVDITDNTFIPDEAADAVKAYAEGGYDLVIAHGSQFGTALVDIAPQYPNTAFAWGTASDTFGLPNVYAYDAAAQEGGYVIGTMATMLSSTGNTGVVGPIDVGDASQYVKGFVAGAEAQNPAGEVLVTFTGSFSDVPLASEAAQDHINNGADVLTGSAQMVVGAITTADQQGVKWFGTQANQTSLAPNSVVASQVYRWEVVLAPILDDVAAGRLQGTIYTADLANGGLAIEFNPDFPLPPEVTQRAEQVAASIVNGSIIPPG